MLCRQHILASVVQIDGKTLLNCIHNFSTIFVHLLLIKRMPSVVPPEKNKWEVEKWKLCHCHFLQFWYFYNRNNRKITFNPSLSPWYCWNSWLCFFRSALISSSFLNVQYRRWELDGNISSQMGWQPTITIFSLKFNDSFASTKLQIAFSTEAKLCLFECQRSSKLYNNRWTIILWNLDSEVCSHFNTNEIVLQCSTNTYMNFTLMWMWGAVWIPNHQHTTIISQWL